LPSTRWINPTAINILIFTQPVKLSAKNNDYIQISSYFLLPIYRGRLFASGNSFV